MDWNRHLVKGPSPATTPAAAPATSSAPASTPASSAVPAPVPAPSGNGNSGAASVDQNVVLDDCNNVGIVEPSSYTPSCADSSYVLNNIQWTTWTAQCCPAGSGRAALPRWPSGQWRNERGRPA